MSPQLDGATVEVIRNHLGSIVEQMRRTLVRTAFNPVIYDVLDFGISLYDKDLKLIAGSGGMPAFVGANDFAVPKVLEHLGREKIKQGDVVLLNYPYWSSAHSYDAMLLAPVFPSGSDPDTGAAHAFLAVRAHWMDLGAIAPGYVLDSTDMHQEGLIFPGTRIVKEYVVDEEIIDLVRFNSRLPDLTLGDFHAQLSCLRVGERELTRFWDRFGVETVEEAGRQIVEHGERSARRAVAALPDGTWTAQDWLDDDGITEDPILMVCTVTVAGDEMTIDFTGSSPAVPGPVNVPLGATISMGKTVFKAVTTPDEPANAGHYAPITVIAEKGSLFHAEYPAATFTLWTTTVALELISKALSQGLDTLSASSGSDEPGFMALGRNPRNDSDYVVSNNEGVGWGATKDHDGAMAKMHPSMSAVQNTPVEVLEHKAAIFHERLELIPDSGGAGRWRGGLGVLRQVRYLATGEVLSMKKKTTTLPWALNGGHEPTGNGMTVFPGTDRERDLRMRRATMHDGDRFLNRSAGGGGWGNPLTRDGDRVRDDVLDGYVTRDAARDVYGIDVLEDGSWTPTEVRRRNL